MSVQWVDCTTYNDLVGQVGVEGIEPTRCRSHGIYSPANLLSRLHSQIIGKDLRTFLYRLYVKPAGVLKNSTYSISFNKLSFILNLLRPCTLVSYLFNILNSENVIVARDATSAWRLIPMVRFEPTTLRLWNACSTTELHRLIFFSFFI